MNGMERMNAQPTHHPDAAWLLDHAHGGLPRGFDAVVSSHLRVCAHCRATQDELLRLGGTLVEASPELPPTLTAAAVLARAKALPGAAPVLAPSTPVSIDDDLAPRLGFDWESLAWQRGYPRALKYAELPGSGDERIVLLRAAPGVALPAHRHAGAELTLVVRGSYRTDSVEFAAGDVDEGTDGEHHRPVVCGDCECISLVVLAGELRFGGLLGFMQRLLNT